jgi:hypothetical protein
LGWGTVDERLTAIFATIGRDELAAVARAALGAPEALLQAVEFVQIKRSQADARTIGIVRVSGTALVAGVERAWSAVTKLIDLAVPNALGTPVDPRNEVLVYERGLFAGNRGGMRPARCHHISRPSETLTVLWLEDLTGAEGPPFRVDQMSEMARHLGTWNALTAVDPPALDFPIGNDFQIRSAEGFDYGARVADLLTLRDEPMVREMFARHPVEVADAYVSAYLKLIERSKTLPHALALADCPIGNFFHLPGETIAIDFAGLGREPLGADGGRFIGSALTWGRGFIDIARNERALFESYLAGLRGGGATEDRALLRSGYLSELGFYLSSSLMMPSIFAKPKAGLSIDYFEKRYNMPIAEFGIALAGLVDLIPSYVDEIHELLAQINA